MYFTAYPEPSILPAAAVLVLSSSMAIRQGGFYYPVLQGRTPRPKRENYKPLISGRTGTGI